MKNRIYICNRRLSTGEAIDRRNPTTGKGVVAACLAVALSVVPGLAIAQDVTIAPKLAIGDEFRLALVRTRDNSAQPQQNSTSRTVISVRVTSAGADGYVLDWVPGETEVDNQQLARNPVVMAAVEAVRGLHFRLTLNADGELTGLANQDGSGNGIFGQRFSSTATRIGGEFQINTYTEDSQGGPSIDSDAQGGFVVVWNSYYQDGSAYQGSFGQRFASNGQRVGTEFQVNSYTLGSQDGPAVAVKSSSEPAALASRKLEVQSARSMTMPALVCRSAKSTASGVP